MQDTIYQPPPTSYQRASVHFIKTVRGDRLDLRCISPCGSSMSLHCNYADSRPVVLYSHGNATDLGGCHDVSETIASMLDAHVIVYDYPNYGVSSKTRMCESVLNSSIEAVYSRFCELEIPQSKIILIGQSLGSVPTLFLASRVYAKYATIVLISPLASAFRTEAIHQYSIRATDSYEFRRIARPAATSTVLRYSSMLFLSTTTFPFSSIRMFHCRTSSTFFRMSHNNRLTTIFGSCVCSWMCVLICSGVHSCSRTLLSMSEACESISSMSSMDMFWEMYWLTSFTVLFAPTMYRQRIQQVMPLDVSSCICMCIQGHIFLLDWMYFCRV
jgi:pimeloyl-ACP methyl ester carboxylesterase